MEQLLYSLQEACGLLGVKKDMLYRYINSGQLESTKIGRRRLFSKQQLENFVANMAVKDD